MANFQHRQRPGALRLLGEPLLRRPFGVDHQRVLAIGECRQQHLACRDIQPLQQREHDLRDLLVDRFLVVIEQRHAEIIDIGVDGLHPLDGRGVGFGVVLEAIDGAENGIAAEVLRERQRLGAVECRMFAVVVTDALHAVGSEEAEADRRADLGDAALDVLAEFFEVLLQPLAQRFGEVVGVLERDTPQLQILVHFLLAVAEDRA